MNLPVPSDQEAAKWLLDALQQVNVPIAHAEHAVAIKLWLREKMKPEIVDHEGDERGTAPAP